MRYKYEEIATSGKPRLLLATGVAELRVLKGLLDNACRHMPLAGRHGTENSDYISTARTIRNMTKEVGKALIHAERYDEDGKSKTTTE